MAPLPEVFAETRRLGAAGIEIIGRHLGTHDVGELRALRQAASSHGLSVVAVSAHHNPVVADTVERRKHVDIVADWVDAAVELGAPYIRVFGGRWGTTRKFADLMAAKGAEPPLPGYTDNDAFAWAIDALGQAAYYASRRGITLALENHWGLTGTVDGVLRILKGVNSPALRAVLDTGNFLSDPYAEMRALAPHAVMVHAKYYHGGGLYYTAAVDWKQVASILKNSGFDGWVSLEFEGKSLPSVALPEGVAELRAAFGG
jgi:sugar phosphate isomerase/epimerase